VSQGICIPFVIWGYSESAVWLKMIGNYKNGNVKESTGIVNMLGHISYGKIIAE
jgi:hypothetical protein